MKVAGKTHCSVSTGSVWCPSLRTFRLPTVPPVLARVSSSGTPRKCRLGRELLPGIGHLGPGQSAPQQHLFGAVAQVGREGFEVIETKPNQTVFKTRQLLFGNAR